jgi:hypothetical protein
MKTGLASEAVKWSKETRHEFLCGFARAAKICCYEEAASHWDAFSRFLSPKEREAIEAGGRESGEEYGHQYRTLFDG